MKTKRKSLDFDIISVFLNTLIMQIILNGETIDVPADLSLDGLIQHLALGEKRLAIELNREIVPRSQYIDVNVQPNDEIEIVHAIGGG